MGLGRQCRQYRTPEDDCLDSSYNDRRSFVTVIEDVPVATQWIKIVDTSNAGEVPSVSTRTVRPGRGGSLRCRGTGRPAVVEDGCVEAAGVLSVNQKLRSDGGAVLAARSNPIPCWVK